MTGISPIEAGSPGRVGRVSDAPRRATPGSDAGSARRSGGGDQVQVSDMARYLARLRQVPDIREELVQEIRGQIESGAYDTPEKVDAAIDALVQELGES